jgi:hypothetical protein
LISDFNFVLPIAIKLVKIPSKSVGLVTGFSRLIRSWIVETDNDRLQCKTANLTGKLGKDVFVDG